MTRAGRAAARLGALLCAASLAGGCTTALTRPAGDLEAEVRDLRVRLVEMQRQAAVNQLALEELRAQVASLEAALGVRRGPTGTSTARPASPPPAAAGSRRTVPEPVVEAEPVREEELEIAEVDAPPVPVAPPAASERAPAVRQPAAAPAAEPVAPPSSVAPGATIPPAGQALYDRGYTLYHQGRYLDAEASFQRFLQAHGDSELADNAQYWIGESRYARGDHRGALAAFQETAARYPEGNKVPDALLKAGQSLEELGDPEGARAAYRTVLDRFGTSAAAVAAEERLARLP